MPQLAPVKLHVVEDSCLYREGADGESHADKEGLINRPAESPADEKTEDKGDNKTACGNDKGGPDMLQQLLWVHLHPGIEHEEEDAEVSHEFQRFGCRDDTEEWGAEYQPGEEFTQNDRQAEPGEERAQDPGDGEDEDKGNDYLLSNHRSFLHAT